jgi:hypothetical protein
VFGDKELRGDDWAEDGQGHEYWEKDGDELVHYFIEHGCVN